MEAAGDGVEGGASGGSDGEAAAQDVAGGAVELALGGLQREQLGDGGALTGAVVQPDAPYNVIQNLFDGGRRKAVVDQAKAATDEAKTTGCLSGLRGELFVGCAAGCVTSCR